MLLLSKKDSFASRVSAITIYSTFIIITTLSIFFIYSNFIKYKSFEREMVREQVSLTISMNENSRLLSNFDYIAKRLWGMTLIKGIVLINDDCNILAKRPLNITINKGCYFEKDNGWIIHKVNDPFSKLSKVAIKLKSKYFSIFLDDLKIVISIIIVLSFLFLYLTKIIILQLFERPFSKIIEIINTLTKSDQTSITFDSSKFPIEIIPIMKALNQTKQSLKKTKKELVDQTKFKATQKIYKQVAHDIRSPLSAMSMIMPDLDILSEETRLILRSSIQRIQDISNNLSAKKNPSESKKCNILSPQLLSGCIEEIISEKRLHFRSLLQVNIQSNLGNSYGFFSNINLTDFKRVLSNLINNAVESFNKNSGTVTVHLNSAPHLNNKSSKKVQIIVEDNGKGIPENIISKLGQKGASFGKTNHKESGSGLGLYHAKDSIESWSGNFEIKSKVGVGTKIILTLPKAKEPSWFALNLEIEEQSAIVILDDDQGIHQTWTKKLKDNNILENNIFHLSCPDLFSKWMKEKSKLFKKHIYLCDFELIGFKKTGLDLIEEFSLGKDAILVTGHYEDEDIQARCKISNIRLIPKMIVAYIPINAARP